MKFEVLIHFEKHDLEQLPDIMDLFPLIREELSKNYQEYFLVYKSLLNGPIDWFAYGTVMRGLNLISDAIRLKLNKLNKLISESSEVDQFITLYTKELNKYNIELEKINSIISYFYDNMILYEKINKIALILKLNESQTRYVDNHAKSTKNITPVV